MVSWLLYLGRLVSKADSHAPLHLHFSWLWRHGLVHNGDVGEDVWSDELYTKRSSGITTAGPGTQIKVMGYTRGASTKGARSQSPMGRRGKGTRRLIHLLQVRVQLHPLCQMHRVLSHPWGLGPSQKILSLNPWLEQLVSPTGGTVQNVIGLHHCWILQCCDGGAKHGHWDCECAVWRSHPSAPEGHCNGVASWWSIVECVLLGWYICPPEPAFKEHLLLQPTLENCDDLFDWANAKLNQRFWDFCLGRRHEPSMNIQFLTIAHKHSIIHFCTKPLLL